MPGNTCEQLQGESHCPPADNTSVKQLATGVHLQEQRPTQDTVRSSSLSPDSQLEMEQMWRSSATFSALDCLQDSSPIPELLKELADNPTQDPWTEDPIITWEFPVAP